MRVRPPALAPLPSSSSHASPFPPHSLEGVAKTRSKLTRGVLDRFLLPTSPSRKNAMTVVHLLYALAALISLLLLLSIRLLRVLHRTHSPSRAPPPRPSTDEATLAVFLGSGASCHSCPSTRSPVLTSVTLPGGHTAEMMRLVAHLDFDKRFQRRVWIISNGDGMSEGKALELERRIGSGEVCYFDRLQARVDG